jgi:hypothetical protein
MKYFLIFQLLLITCPGKAQQKSNELSSAVNIESTYKELIALKSGAANLKIDTCNSKYKKLIIDMESIFDSIYKKNNYPGYKELGRKASQQLFTLLQNYKEQNKRKKTLLKLMYDQVIRKNESADNYAKLTDQLLYDEKKEQVYGTLIAVSNISYNIKESDIKLIVYPITDSINVDKRRAAIYLPSLSIYMKQLKNKLSSDLSAHKN